MDWGVVLAYEKNLFAVIAGNFNPVWMCWPSPSEPDANCRKYDKANQYS